MNLRTGWKKEPSKDYFSARAINNSLIKEALISPKNILSYQKPEKEAFHFGRAFHYLILEPDRFDEMVRVRNGGIGTQKFAEQLMKYDDADNMAFISANEFELVQRLAKELKSYPEVKARIKGCEYELSGYLQIWNKGSQKEYYKIKVDGIHRKKGYIFDVKTVTSDNLQNFGKAIAKYRWDIQAAFYCWVATKIEKHLGTGIEYSEFYWICIEKTPPHNVKIFQAPLSCMYKGELDGMRGIHIIKHAKKTGIYRGEVEEIPEMPYWYEKDLKHYK